MPHVVFVGARPFFFGNLKLFAKPINGRAIASNGEELEEVAMIPCGDFLFGAHAAFFGGVLAQEIEGKVA